MLEPSFPVLSWQKCTIPNSVRRGNCWEPQPVQIWSRRETLVHLELSVLEETEVVVVLQLHTWKSTNAGNIDLNVHNITAGGILTFTDQFVGRIQHQATECQPQPLVIQEQIRFNRWLFLKYEYGKHKDKNQIKGLTKRHLWVKTRQEGIPLVIQETNSI